MKQHYINTCYVSFMYVWRFGFRSLSLKFWKKRTVKSAHFVTILVTQPPAENNSGHIHMVNVVQMKVWENSDSDLWCILCKDDVANIPISLPLSLKQCTIIYAGKSCIHSLECQSNVVIYCSELWTVHICTLNFQSSGIRLMLIRQQSLLNSRQSSVNYTFVLKHFIQQKWSIYFFLDMDLLYAKIVFYGHIIFCRTSHTFLIVYYQNIQNSTFWHVWGSYGLLYNQGTSSKNYIAALF